MAVDRILVEGFKSIAECDLSLRPLNVLIGANGAGKSNFIGVFRLLNQIAARNLRSYVTASGGADSLLHFGRKQTGSIYVRIRADKNGYAARLAPDAEDNLYFESETAYFYGRGIDKKPFDEPLGSGHQESKLHGKPKTPSYVLAAMRTWRVYHFHDTSDSAKVKATSDIDDNSSLRADASNLAAFLFKLRAQSREAYGQIVNAIRLVAPFFEDFALRPNPRNDETIRLEWTESGSDAYLNAHALSDGTLRFICLATLLLQPELPQTILIDEPELGLHPAAIRTLTELFRLASARTQLIVSTQSVPLVNQLEPDDLIVVEREEDTSTFRRLLPAELSQWVDEYGLGDLWEKNVIGGRP